MWPDGRQWCTSVDQFPADEVWQAAAFDAVVAHNDHLMNNWFGVPDPSLGTTHLRLVDTGNAFDLGGNTVPLSISVGMVLISHPLQPSRPPAISGRMSCSMKSWRVKMPSWGVPLAGVLKLVTDEGREQRAVSRLGRDGDAVQLPVLVAVGLLALRIVAGKPRVAWINVCVRPKPRGP